MLKCKFIEKLEIHTRVAHLHADRRSLSVFIENQLCRDPRSTRRWFYQHFNTQKKKAWSSTEAEFDHGFMEEWQRSRKSRFHRRSIHSHSWELRKILDGMKMRVSISIIIFQGHYERLRWIIINNFSNYRMWNFYWQSNNRTNVNSIRTRVSRLCDMWCYGRFYENCF